MMKALGVLASRLPCNYTAPFYGFADLRESRPLKKSHSEDPGTIDVAYVAHLARLHLTGEEIEAFQGQLAQVVQYVEQLNELDVEGIEPTSHAVPVQNVMREDEPSPSMNRDRALANAPEHRAGQFAVPRIIE